MKRVVKFADYRQADIKPHDLFDQYLEISSEEVRRLLIDEGKLASIKCPACDSERRIFAFKKFGLDYVECRHCGTLYISPRPSEERINRYFLESKASDFWSKHVLKETIKARVEHLINPEVMWVANTTEELLAKPEVFVDIKSRYAEFLEGINGLSLFRTKIAIDPEISIPETLTEGKGFRVIEESVQNVDISGIGADVVTGFYLVDRSYGPPALLECINSMLVKRGLLFLISSTISGLDLQVLWEKAKTIFPPENMNIFSIEGIEILLERSGFEIIELSTPGQLDIEYIKTAIERDETLEVPRFISYLIKKRDEDAHRAFQEFLQQFRLSSHLRVVARKR